MERSLFSGWQDVFFFTLKQTTGKKFRSVTAVFAVILLLAGMAISIVMAIIQKKDGTEVSPIETVHIIDESGLGYLYLDGFKELHRKDFPAVSFVTVAEQQKPEELAAKLGEKAPKDVILQITHSEEGYLLTVLLPYGTEIKQKEGEKLNDAMIMVMEQSKLLSSGIPMENLTYVMSRVDTAYLDAGEEEKSMGEEMVAMLLPLLMIYLTYLMIFIYGMNVGNIVSVEKASKLMEMLLTLTRPYGLIFGKICAVVVTAVLQMFLWIASLVLGFFLGHFVAGNLIYPEYVNILLEVFKIMKGEDGSLAFSIGAILLALFTLCLAFVFYCMLAGLIASFASKAEELAQVMSYYQIIMVVSFMGAVFLPLKEKKWISTLIRLVPFISAYLLPGDLVVGNVKLWEGILDLAVLAVSSLVLVIFTGKVYKNRLFYTGKSLQERLPFLNLNQKKTVENGQNEK